MPLNPDTAEQERLAVAASRRRTGVMRREGMVEIVFGAGFFAAVVALWQVAGAPASEIDVVPALACIACLAVAVNVPFAVGDGYTVPTQLAFVPLLFTLPPALVPPAVVLALVGARVPSVAAARWPVSRLLLVPGDAWFSLGPALVLAAAGTHSVGHLSVLVLVALLLAQALAEIAAWAVRERLLGGAGLREQVGELWIHGVDLALTPLALVVALVVDERPWAVLAFLPLLGVLAIFSRERQGRLASLTELNETYRGTALVLGDIVGADDRYTGEHSHGVVALAMEVGEALGLDPAERRNLEFGALLHDVGKVAIPKEIINKPGALDAAEWAVVKTHTVEGQQMLDRVGGFMRDVGLIVRSHHERWDGGGYPDGLSGEQIPLEARIVCCCDAWNAMTTTRSYRVAMPIAEAMIEMRRCAGGQFDPRVVDALLQRVLPPGHRGYALDAPHDLAA
jgi:putative nucleotidyltransferase with HDIG domain